MSINLNVSNGAFSHLCGGFGWCSIIPFYFLVAYSVLWCVECVLIPFYCFRPEMVVGWYHSHPGFGCWLSGVDINTQQSFEALSERAVAVVVDPIQSVKGKVCVSVCSEGYKLKI